MKTSFFEVVLACSLTMFFSLGFAQEKQNQPSPDVVVPAVTASPPSTQKAEAEKWLSKKRFSMYFEGAGLTYQTYPKDGYTYMNGWDNPCGRGQVPTTFSVNDDGRLTLEFNMEKGCPHFKYVFTGTKGEIFLRDKSGNWKHRPLTVELRD